MTGTTRDRGAREPSRAPDNGAVGSPPRLGLLLRLMALVATVGILAAACSSTGGASAPDPEASTEAALLAFSQCMRDQGITDMPDPTVDSDGNVQIQRPPGGHSSGAHEAFAAAGDKCDKYLRGATRGSTPGA